MDEGKEREAIVYINSTAWATRTPLGVLIYNKTSSMLCSHSYLRRVKQNQDCMQQKFFRTLIAPCRRTVAAWALFCLLQAIENAEQTLLRPGLT